MNIVVDASLVKRVSLFRLWYYWLFSSGRVGELWCVALSLRHVSTNRTNKLLFCSTFVIAYLSQRRQYLLLGVAVEKFAVILYCIIASTAAAMVSCRHSLSTGLWWSTSTRLLMCCYRGTERLLLSIKTACSCDSVIGKEQRREAAWWCCCVCAVRRGLCGLWFVGGGPRGEEKGGRERKEKGRIFWRSRFFIHLPSTFYLGLPPAPPEPLPLSKVTKAPKPYLVGNIFFFSGRFFSQHLSLIPTQPPFSPHLSLTYLNFPSTWVWVFILSLDDIRGGWKVTLINRVYIIVTKLHVKMVYPASVHCI